MKRIAVRMISVLCALCVLISVSAVSAGAMNFSNNVDIHCEAVLMVNTDNEQVVFEKNADEKRYPASTTKIMTYIVAYEHIDDLDNTQIPIKQSVINMLKDTDSSLANVAAHVGKTMSAVDLLYSMMVPSGNDAALTLADYVGEGDVDKFVDMMNEKADELGCENTHFQNPDGLHNEDHYTTARDLYKITTYARTLPLFDEICNTTEYYCKGDNTPLITTNYLIDSARGGQYYYQYARGIKTGTTDEAGRCLVTTGSADGNSYILVLLGAPYKMGVQEEYYTFIDAAALFRWALVDLQMQTVKSKETPICEQPLKLAWAARDTRGAALHRQARRKGGRLLRRQQGRSEAAARDGQPCAGRECQPQHDSCDSGRHRHDIQVLLVHCGDFADSPDYGDLRHRRKGTPLQNEKEKKSQKVP